MTEEWSVFTQLSLSNTQLCSTDGKTDIRVGKKNKKKKLQEL